MAIISQPTLETSVTPQQIPAYILAGGQGQRLGNVDKCLLDLGGRTLLERIRATLLPQCQNLTLNANGDLARFKEYGLSVLPDTLTPPVGPLGGLLAALEHSQQHTPRPLWILTVPGDCPFLPNDLCHQLIAEAKDKTEVVISKSEEREHYITALWSTGVLAKLLSYLNSGKKSAGGFIASLTHATVTFDSATDPFFNINTKAQWQQAIEHIATETAGE